LCTRNHKKKKTTAKMAKVEDWNGFCFRTIDYGTIAHNADGQREFVLLTMVPSR
jgi:hypothetical protein